MKTRKGRPDIRLAPLYDIVSILPYDDSNALGMSLDAFESLRFDYQAGAAG